MVFKSIIGAICTCSAIVSFSANAALVSRLGGSAVYDTDLKITWLADANVNGTMNSADANAWVASLTVGGFTDWRLPTTPDPDASCTDDRGGTIPSADAIGWNCTGSELGHLFYNELGGTVGNSVLSSGDPDLALFSNIQLFYWSATEYTGPRLFYSWVFVTDGNDSGAQYAIPRSHTPYAWAVRTGDVGAVPVPAAVWLFGSGLAGLIELARRKTRI